MHINYSAKKFLIIGLFLGLVTVFYFAHQSQRETFSTQTAPALETSSNPAEIDPKAGINLSTLVKKDNQILFIDPVYNYRLDLSILPQVSLTTLDFDEVYEFEMYQQRPNGRFGEVSVARFGISAPKDPKGLSLMDFAKNDMNYIPGKNIYGGQDSALTPITLNTFKAVTWQETLQIEGPTNMRHYLIDIGGQYVHVQLYSWSETDFRQADSDLKKILKTFEVKK